VITLVPAVVLVWSAVVLVPLALAAPRRGAAAAERPAPRSPALALARRLVWPASALLAGAAVMTPGRVAALCAVPWLVVCGLIASAGLARLLRRGWAPIEELAIDAGFVYLAMGGAWALAWRAGWQVLGFAPAWALLTAAHFHVAGFTLPVVAGLLGRSRVGDDGQLPRPLRWALAGILLAVPLTAAGIAWSRHLEVCAALLLSTATLVVAWSCVVTAGGRTGAARLLTRVSGVALVLTMPLAANYALRVYGMVDWTIALGAGSLDELELMALSHGVLNAVGFAGAGLLAAWLAPAAGRHRDGVPFSALATRGRVGAGVFVRQHRERSATAHGLVDRLDDLGHTDFDPARVAPPIRAFYEHTDAHRLRVVPRWRFGFRLGARLWSRIGRRLDQLQLPVAAETGGENVITRIVALDDAADTRPGARAWIRTYGDGRAMYVAAYAVHRCDGIAYMNIAFPLPRANLASILRMDSMPGDDSGDAIVLTTVNQQRGVGDAGIWLVTTPGPRALPLALPMNETICVWTPAMPGAPNDLAALATSGTTCIARHELRLFGIRYLTLDYVIEPG